MARALHLVQGVVLVVSLLIAGVAHADDYYQGVRLHDSGPFQVWHGINDDNTNEMLIVIRGSTKSVTIHYPLLSLAEADIHNFQSLGYVQVFLEAGEATMGLRPLDPPAEDSIMYCETVSGGKISCLCDYLVDSTCSQVGTVSFGPNTGWLDL